MKLGVITDGISRDLDHALDVLTAAGLEHAELQHVGEHEVGDHSSAEIAAIRASLERHGTPVSCLSRHVFAGLTATSRPGDPDHTRHMDALARTIDMAYALDAPRVRIMSSRREQILFGSHGAERWNVAHGAWESLAPLIEPAVALARSAGIRLVIETGNGTMVNSAVLARRLIDELDALDVLQVLWDPANACWCHERAWPDAFAALRGGYLGHVHVKDVLVDTPRATLEVRELGRGQLGEQYGPIADALRADGYAGSVSLEAVYHCGDGDFEAGFHACVGRFKAWFGAAA